MSELIPECQTRGEATLGKVGNILDLLISTYASVIYTSFGRETYAWRERGAAKMSVTGSKQEWDRSETRLVGKTVQQEGKTPETSCQPGNRAQIIAVWLLNCLQVEPPFNQLVIPVNLKTIPLNRPLRKPKSTIWRNTGGPPKRQSVPSTYVKKVAMPAYRWQLFAPGRGTNHEKNMSPTSPILWVSQRHAIVWQQRPSIPPFWKSSCLSLTFQFVGRGSNNVPLDFSSKNYNLM